MTCETTLDLVKAYVALADMHRKTAMEQGPYSSLRALHFAQAEIAEIHAIAWQHRADRQFRPATREVSHG
jgi:hypothetical protein